MAIYSPISVAYKLININGKITCNVQPNAIVGMSLTMNKYVLAMIFVFNVIPFALITIVYLIIILMLWSPKVIFGRGNVDAKMQVQQVKRQQNVLKMALAISLGVCIMLDATQRPYDIFCME